jgi:3-dehydroquinate dehydratase
VLLETLLRSYRPTLSPTLGHNQTNLSRQPDENLRRSSPSSLLSMVCGWLLGADAQSFNCDHFTELLKSLPKFANLPVACRKRVMEMEKEEYIHPGEGTQGIAILCNADYLTETNIAMKATFNRSTPQAIAQRPDGYNFKNIEYFAEAKSKTATHKQLTTTKKAKFKQNKFYDNIRRIRISGIHCLDYARNIPNPDSTPQNPLPDRRTTCRQMISSLKCQDNYEYQLINQMHEQHDNSIIGVCNRDQHKEAASVLGHPRVILNERYGSRTDAWFTQKPIDAAKGYYFCALLLTH